MPQLDPSSFSSQLFWLAISFTLLYIVMARFALPRIAGVVQRREERMEDDIDAAEQLRKEAQELQELHDSIIAETRGNAGDVIAKAVAAAKEEAKAQHADLEKDLQEAAKKAEDKIAKMRDDIIATLLPLASELSGDVVKKLTGLSVDAKVTEKTVSGLLKGSQ